MKEKILNWSQNLRSFIRLDQTKSTTRKVFSSVWSVVLGLFVAIIIIAILGQGNPFVFFEKWGEAFKGTKVSNLLIYLIIFGFAGLASAIGFKSGLFNIGISGQMMISGLVGFSLLMVMGVNGSNINLGHLIMIMVLSIILGAFISMIAGVLKAYLNVHEVISTIMLNWIIVNLAKYLFNVSRAKIIWGEQIFNNYFSTQITIGTKPEAFGILSNAMVTGFSVFGIILFIVVAIGMFLMYKQTTFGYKLKMLGLSKTNGKYIGVNEKISIVLVMSVSGAFAGFAGFMYYFFKESMLFQNLTVPLGIGFDGIAISLLALNSSIGIILSSLFYAMLYTIAPSLQSNPLYLKPDDVQIITAAILYLAALSQMLYNFKPFNFVWRSIVNVSSKKWWLLLKIKYLNLQKEKLIKTYSLKKAKIELNIKESNKDSMLNEYKKAKEISFIKLSKLDNQLDYYKEMLNLQKGNQTIDKNVIQQLKTDLVSKNNQPVEIYYDLAQFKAKEKSKIELVKELNKEFKQEQDKFLNLVYTTKDKSAQIKAFEQIGLLKQKHWQALNEINIDAIKNVKMQHKANIKELKNHYKLDVENNYQSMMNVYIKPWFNKAFNFKKGAK
ncbi:ABC transporter permease subunit [Mycoplasmopsis gallinarum]